MAKGRFTAEYRQLLKSPQWLIIRTAVKKRDGYKCVKCGTKGGKSNRIEINHKRYPPKGSPLQAFFDQPLSDYECLCHNCHAKYTKQTRKAAKR